MTRSSRSTVNRTEAEVDRIGERHFARCRIPETPRIHDYDIASDTSRNSVDVSIEPYSNGSGTALRTVKRGRPDPARCCAREDHAPPGPCVSAHLAGPIVPTDWNCTIGVQCLEGGVPAVLDAGHYTCHLVVSAYGWGDGSGYHHTQSLGYSTRTAGTTIRRRTPASWATCLRVCIPTVSSTLPCPVMVRDPLCADSRPVVSGLRRLSVWSGLRLRMRYDHIQRHPQLRRGTYAIPAQGQLSDPGW